MKKHVSQPGGHLTMYNAPEAVHASVRASTLEPLFRLSAPICPYHDRRHHSDRGTPSADVLQRIYTFSSSMASVLSGSEQSPGTPLALRALSYVQTLACRLSGGYGSTLGRCVCPAACSSQPATASARSLSWRAPAACDGALLLSRQHIRRLQQVAGTLMHAKSRSDPFTTASRAPLTARTASTPVFHLDAPSPKGHISSSEAEEQGAAADPTHSSDRVAAERPPSQVPSCAAWYSI